MNCYEVEWKNGIKHLLAGFMHDFYACHNVKKKNIYVNDSQNLAFPTSHFVIELLPFDYLGNQKQKNAFQEE
jgi:hypothetical protein